MNFSVRTRARRHGVVGSIAAAVALCLAISGLTMQPAQAANTGAITGKVFTQATGGSKIAARSGYIYLSYSATANGNYSYVDTNTSTPGTEGYSFNGNTYRLAKLKAGYYKFEMAGVGVDGYQREYYNDGSDLHSAKAIKVGTGTVTAADMIVEPAGQISGRVTSRDGKPLANTNLEFERTDRGGGYSAKTDANGYYKSNRNPSTGFGTGLVKGSYRVRASDWGSSSDPDAVHYEPRYWKDSATFAGATPVTVTPGKTTGNVNIKLDSAPRVRLAVKDSAGRPLANTDVGIWLVHDGVWQPYQAGPFTTDSKGIFRWTMKIGDRFKFFITPPAHIGGATKWYRDAYTATEASEVTVTAQGQIRNIEIKLDPAPKVTGSARVGKALVAKPSTSGLLKSSLTYQWLANGSAIAKATRSTFKVTNAQAGKSLAVRVTGKRANSASLSELSAVTARVTGVMSPKKVKITGTRKVGKKLRADTAAWAAKPVKLSYKWYRNGKAISKQTNRHYKLRKADKGKRISVRIHQRKTHYATVHKLSSRTGKIK